MKILIDFIPIILFFIAYKTYDIYVATAVAIVATMAQMGYVYAKEKKLEKMHWITLILIVVMGGATILFQDDTFIKWKPSVLNWAFALVFLGSFWIGQKTLAERIMGQAVDLPSALWRRINAAWVGFFTFAGAANYYVAFNYDTDTWVNFKLFGLMGLTFVFIIGLALYIGWVGQKIPANNDLANTDKEF